MSDFNKFGWLEKYIFPAPDLHAAEKVIAVAMWLKSDSKTGGSIFPSIGSIAEQTGSTPKKVRDTINKVLVAKGYLVLVAAGGNQNRKGFANEYRLGVPHRISDEPRVSATGSLGDVNETKGIRDDPTRVSVTVPQGYPSRGVHPVIDPVIDPLMSNSHELPDVFDEKSINDATRRNMVNIVRKAGAAKANAKNGTWDQQAANDNYNHALDQLSWQIRDLYGNDAQTFVAEQWTIPAEAQDKQEANSNLTALLATCQTQAKSLTS